MNVQIEGISKGSEEIIDWVQDQPEGVDKACQKMIDLLALSESINDAFEALDAELRENGVERVEINQKEYIEIDPDNGFFVYEG